MATVTTYGRGNGGEAFDLGWDCDRSAVAETVFLSPLKSGRPVSCTYIKAEKAKYNSFLKSNTYGQCSRFADIYPVLIPLPFPVVGLAVTPSCTQL